jgi:hypothetical protein
MPPNSSPSRALADHLLGRPVVEWIAEQRAANVSWRLIERELLRLTDGQVDVTHETIRSWAALAEVAERSA